MWGLFGEKPSSIPGFSPVERGKPIPRSFFIDRRMSRMPCIIGGELCMSWLHIHHVPRATTSPKSLYREGLFDINREHNGGLCMKIQGIVHEDT